jgi:hypothetical protein
MKRFNLFFGALCASMVAFGQVKVDNSGSLNVGSSVKLGSSGLHIDYTTRGSTGVYFKALQISNAPNYDATGVHGEAHNNVTSYLARQIGVYGYATTYPGSKVAIGVAGVAPISGNHIAVAGATYGTGSLPTSVPSLYAGYFVGPVLVSGNLTATTITQSSDERLKSNMLLLNNEKMLNKLMLLKPIEYNYKQVETETDSLNSDGERVKYNTKRYYEESQEFQKKHYGFLAQELQKVYPDLVYEGGDGYLEINYTGLIPLLVSSIQELNEKIYTLERALNSDAVRNNASANASQQKTALQQEIINETVAALFQNSPNPFSEKTEIAYYLPQDTQRAFLYVYDMNGNQLKQLSLTQKGNASNSINGGQLGAGMYLYSLIADNQLIDTKRMVLTK